MIINKLLGVFGSQRLLQCRTFAMRIAADGKAIPKKKTFENRITLIGADNTVSIIDLKSAESLSLRRELKLVKIQDVDSKTRRPVYKLMTNSEYHEEELEKRKERQEARQRNSIKGQKLLNLSSKIGEHDLMTSVKKMIKLLEKQYEVQVILMYVGQDGEKVCEKMYDIIEKNTKSAGKLVQKRNKGNSLRFQLLPVRENSTQTGGVSDQNTNGNDKGPL
ncbi:unnamed protein product [Chilo suppressalis]|uniref:Translation initiation factor 3 N-terminal domain-containing protein n=1 Tax=Chilo suppressalis TaxID=168631 RepID=A0ABN8AWG3_CHISP|nr:unnamed protein product [Chilo suppressalis]